MKTMTKTMIATAGILAMALAPAAAHAERVYFLVGTRHVFRIGLNRDANLEQRIEIEKTYADGVAADRDTFQKNLDAGADREKESDLLNEDLDRLADDRDKALGEMFEREDGLRERHPELRIDGDGPYQVMGIEFHMHRDVEVFDRFVVYAPWPGYVFIGRPYGGWVWGIEYGPTVFFDLYWGWHEHYYHGERFVPGFYGHRGPVVFAPHGFVDRRPTANRGPASGRGGYGGYGRGNTYTHSTGTGRGGSSAGNGYTGGYSHSTGTSSRPSGTGHIDTGHGTSGYTGGYGRGHASDSNAGTTTHTGRSGGTGTIGGGTATGGYSHGRDGGSGTGSTGTGTTGSTGSTRSGGYGTHTSRSDGTGTFGSGRSTGSSRGSDSSTGGRSSGGSSEGHHSSGSSSHDSKSTDKKKGGN